MKAMIRCFLVVLFLPTLGFAQPYWQLQNTNFPQGVWAVSLSAPNEQVCWAAGNIWPPNTGSPYAGYSRTTDGGNTWVCDSIPGAENGYLSQIVGTGCGHGVCGCVSVSLFCVETQRRVQDHRWRGDLDEAECVCIVRRGSRLHLLF